MIVPMRKVFVACQAARREELIAALGRAGVLHLSPVDPAVVVPVETLRQQLALCDRVPGHLAGVVPAGAIPALEPLAVAHEIELVANRLVEDGHELQVLERELAAPRPWGEVRLADLDRLAAHGCQVELLAAPATAVAAIPAAIRAIVGHLPGRRELVAVAGVGEALPLGVERIPRPVRDADGLRAEIAMVGRRLAADRERLAALAHHAPAIARCRAALATAGAVDMAHRSGYADGGIFALQGWVPADAMEPLADSLRSAGLAIGLTDREPAPTEEPPTLVRYPRWTRPIAGLFRVLGSVAGYREADVGPVFILSLPLFCAIIFSDWGYGLLLAALAVILGRRIRRAMGAPFLALMWIVAFASIAWGVCINSFFGCAILPFAIPVTMPDGTATTLGVSAAIESQRLMMFFSFTIALLHLATAWLWQVVRQWPDPTAWASLGWAAVVVGMYGVVLQLILQYRFDWGTPWPYALVGGMALAVLFTAPHRGLLARLAIGLINLPLNVVGKFGDMMSYIRLMAISMAGSLMALSFNDLALRICEDRPALWPMTILVLIFGHGLNFSLCLIALFAHGVRLNMLEFSTNFGMTWSGHAYQPFAVATPQET